MKENLTRKKNSCKTTLYQTKTHIHHRRQGRPGFFNAPKTGKGRNEAPEKKSPDFLIGASTVSSAQPHDNSFDKWREKMVRDEIKCRRIIKKLVLLSMLFVILPLLILLLAAMALTL
jgi:ABC-type uncharacterized transport system involved in gliding motility auxiliary subunit